MRSVRLGVVVTELLSLDRAYRVPRRWRMRALAAALLLSLALPGSASETRAIKQRVPPIYPELAKRMKITGEVKVDATVDADGKVTDAKAVSGSRVLCMAAEDAVRKWKFAAGPGVAHVDVSVKFEIAGQ
jgi:TonB family protein